MRVVAQPQPGVRRVAVLQTPRNRNVQGKGGAFQRQVHTCSVYMYVVWQFFFHRCRVKSDVPFPCGFVLDMQ